MSEFVAPGGVESDRGSLNILTDDLMFEILMYLDR